MGNVLRHVRGESQRNIMRILNALSGKYSLWELWQDWITMSAISIANVFDGPYRKEREEMYSSRAARYSASELKAFADMLFELVADMDRDPDQDFLGELFMSLDLGNEWRGQFFTPYDVCRMMASMSISDDLNAKIESQGWVSVNDPACGAGALLLAFANECLRHGINFQTSVLFVAQDVDFLAGMMCYIQMSLLGCPGYVVIGNTLTEPSTSRDARGLLPAGGGNVWYTPMYYSQIWSWRRAFATVQLLISVPAQPDGHKPEYTSPVHEDKHGQLSLF